MLRRFLIPGLMAAGLVMFSSTMASVAHAQYPPPPGSNVSLATSDVEPSLGDTISVAVTITDPAGGPVADAECTFSIASQPGSDASVDAGPVTTDAVGVATTTLDVGSTSGTIAVEVTCGELSGVVSVVAGASEGPGETAAAPPASLPDQLPSSGFGAQGGAGGINLYILAAVLLSLVGAGGTLYLIRRTR